MKKYFISAFIFLVLFGLTYFFVFKECDFNLLINSIKGMNPLYLVLTSFLVITYVLLGSLVIKRLLYYLGMKINLYQALGYYFTEIYFSAITPSYIGGQPIQMLEMKKDKIPYQTSSVVVLFSSMFNRIALIFLATIFLLIFNKTLFTLNPVYNWLVILGFITTIMVIIGFAAVIYSKTAVKVILKVSFWFIDHFKIFKKKQELKNKLKKALKEYQFCAAITKSNKRLVMETLSLMILQRFSLLLMSYMIYRAFGFNTYSWPLVMAFQICVTLGADLTPTPGGVMVNEGLLLIVNELLYGSSLALSGMLMLRFFNFYLLVVVSGIFYLFFHFQKRKKAIKLKTIVQ